MSIPPGIDGFTSFGRQLAALQLAGGDPYVGLIQHDVPRQALLLERLGRPMAALGWPASRQLEVLARTAARGWRPVPDHGRLPTWVEAACWHAAFIPAMWEDLAQPCSTAVVDLAVRCAAARVAAFDPGQAVLVHGDVHAFNTVQKLESAGVDVDFRLVNPSGLVSEAAHDLGVIVARGVQGWLDELAAGDPQQAREKVTGSCKQISETTGVDPEAIWQWAYAEMVSTGPHLLRLGDREEAATFVTVADKLAAAAAKPNRALHLGTNVVLDFGLWGRDERSALRWLATSAGASCQVIYLPIDTDVQRARIAHRQATAPHTTFPMTEADIDKWRKQFQTPDAAELRGGRTIPGPPPGWPGWPEWAADRWPSLSNSYGSQS